MLEGIFIDGNFSSFRGYLKVLKVKFYHNLQIKFIKHRNISSYQYIDIDINNRRK